MRRVLWVMALLLCLSVAAGAYSPPNSAQILSRTWNDDSDSILTVVNNFPNAISFDDQKLDGDGVAGEYANLHIWKYSSDGGATATTFAADSFFDIWMDVTVSGDPSTLHEGGMYFETGGWDGKFMVKTNGEIAVFGNIFPFHAFLTPYVPGSTVKLGLKYFLDPNDNKRKITYTAGAESVTKIFTNAEQGLLTNTTFGGYAQPLIEVGNPQHWGRTDFGNITIVPEPASLMVLGSGLIGLVGLRRRR